MIKSVYFITVFSLMLLPVRLSAQADSARLQLDVSDSTEIPLDWQMVSMNGGEADNESDKQDVSSLLLSSKDVFVQFASFQFGAGRYRLRGYTSKNQQVWINGIEMNDPETGNASWNEWGGLNDVTRFAESRYGNLIGRTGLSGIGGYTAMECRASGYKKGWRFSEMQTNRVYRNRAMLSYGSGLLKSGWSMAFSASIRNGDEVMVPGTYYRGFSCYLSVEKKLQHGQSLCLSTLFAPAEQARTTACVEEAYQLSGSDYYNPLWGLQNGQIRNANISRVAKPLVFLVHQIDLALDKRWTTSLFFKSGYTGVTGLNWNGAEHPRPDYYRYLPSYLSSGGDSLGAQNLAESWQNEITIRQLNWDGFIDMNRANLYSLPGEGVQINYNESRGRYILEEKREDITQAVASTVYNGRYKSLFLSAGMQAGWYLKHKYKRLEDLLGASFWLDYDQFAEGLGTDPITQQNNLAQPDRKVRQGEMFGYNYTMQIQKMSGWALCEAGFKHFELYAGVQINQQNIQRQGFYANGKFPQNSQGKSERKHFLNQVYKAGLVYKANGRHFITAHVTYLTRAPETGVLFVSPQWRNTVLGDVGSEKLSSAEISYQIKYPDFRLRWSLYATKIVDQIWKRSTWYDEFNTMVNLIMRNVNQIHKGIEVGIEKSLAVNHVLQLAVGIGDFRYSNRPILEAIKDNTGEVLFSGRKVYLNRYYVGGTPQQVFGFGYRYTANKHWNAGLSLNYLFGHYVEINPDRRTQEALDKFLDNEQQVFQPIVEQEKLPSLFMVNMNAGKSWRIQKKYALSISMAANNLLPKAHRKLSGFEQLRWDAMNLQKFDTKYTYLPGTSFMLLLTLAY